VKSLSSLSVKLGFAIGIIGLVIFSLGEVWGADWKHYGEDDFGSWYYDAETITSSSKATVRVWMKTVYTEKGVIQTMARRGPKFKDLDYGVALLEFNCADRKMRPFDGILYSRDGSVLSTYKFETPYWEEIVPDTVGEDLYEIVCKQPQK
jgi:hypothetical protein